MPTPRKRYRTYCKTCKVFTIHNWSGDSLLCNNCDTKESGYKLSEVDSGLILAQRERYNQQKMKEVSGLYGAFMAGVGIQALMDLGDVDRGIIECDAGQKQIDEDNRLKSTERRKQKEELLEEYSTFNHLNRNDKCSCGSGKKYKKCHLEYFKKHGIND